MNTPFFSIIMPVYGTEDFIAEAIESVQSQTFSNWELILVDDATPDSAAEIAQSFAKVDKRIRVVHHIVNRGLSAARNTGIEESSGKYIWFPDSDDHFDPNLLQAVCEELESTQADVVMFGLTEEYFDPNRNFLYSNQIALEPYRDESNDWHRKIIEYERDTCFGYAWNKIYFLSTIKHNNLHFEDVRLIEDVLFNVEFFSKAAKIAVLGITPYHYRKIDGRSLTNSNSYSAKQYYELHERRVNEIRAMLSAWDVFDDQAREILGSLYGRYVLSSLERTYHDDSFGSYERKQFAKDIVSSGTFQKLVPFAKVKDSQALAMSLTALKSGNISTILVLSKAMNIARNGFYSIFTRLRSGR